MSLLLEKALWKSQNRFGVHLGRAPRKGNLSVNRQRFDRSLAADPAARRGVKMALQPLQVDLMTQGDQYRIFVVALELSRFDPRSLMNDSLGEQKTDRKFPVQSRCAHRDRNRPLNYIWSAAEANTDLKWLFDRQCVGGALRRLIRGNAFNSKPVCSYNHNVFRLSHP